MSKNTEVRLKLVGLCLVLALGAASCSNAPDPGDLGAFCRLLERGSGLTSTPSASDLDLLATAAPPEIRDTIKVLQGRARNFDELMTETPPNLEALFNARFDPVAQSERDILDNYAETSCGIVIDRAPSSRWNIYVRANHADAPWLDRAVPQFDVVGNRIDTATVAFVEEPDPISLLEDVCRAMAEFLISDGADPGRIRIVVGSVVVIEEPATDGSCRLP